MARTKATERAKATANARTARAIAKEIEKKAGQEILGSLV